MNVPREQYVNAIKTGVMTETTKKRIKASLMVLKEAGRPLTMKKEITPAMKPYGWDVKSHYDMFNSLTDCGLVKKTEEKGQEETFEITQAGIKYLGA